MKKGYVVLLTLGMQLLLSVNVYAYLDPGTASYALQMLLAMILGAGATIGIFWTRIKTIFKKKYGKSREVSEEIQDNANFLKEEDTNETIK